STNGGRPVRCDRTTAVDQARSDERGGSTADLELGETGMRAKTIQGKVTTSPSAPGNTEKVASDLSLFRLLNPDVLADPYPLYKRLRTEDPVHWDPYLHSWVVTRYQDVVRVLRDFSADRT